VIRNVGIGTQHYTALHPQDDLNVSDCNSPQQTALSVYEEPRNEIHVYLQALLNGNTDVLVKRANRQ
jgi:hypothetical protein